MSSEVPEHPANERAGIHYEVLGTNGPTLVLLHGWMHSLEALRQMGELFAEHYRVILIDLPGFGRSPLPDGASNEGGGWSTSQYAAVIQNLLAELKVERCTLIGHSFGGHISVRLAAARPELIEALVLIGAPGLPYTRQLKDVVRSRGIKALVALAKRIDALTGSRFFAHYLAPRFGSQDYKAAGALRKTLVKAVNEDLTPEVNAIKAPTLLLWGKEDPQAPLAIGQRYHELLKGSKLIVFPARGHEPFRDVGSHLLVTHIERFLSEVGVGGAD